jgi:hypothetical protein
MLTDAALKPRSKGTAPAFPITGSFFSPSSSLSRKIFVSSSLKTLVKQAFATFSKPQGSLDPLQIPGALPHRRFLPQLAPMESTAMLNASGVSVMRSSMPLTPVCNEVTVQILQPTSKSFPNVSSPSDATLSRGLNMKIFRPLNNRTRKTSDARVWIGF